MLFYKNNKSGPNAKKKGFTLSEILITLAIIGVVASLTIRSVVVEVQKEQTAVKLKKAYTTLWQALYRSEAANGSYTSWNYNLTADEFFERYLDGFVVQGKEKVFANNVKYYELNGKALNLWIFQKEGHGTSFTLRDGTKIYMADSRPNGSIYQNPDHVMFLFDLNGDKKPNTIGKDMFAFALYTRKGLLPFFTSDGNVAANTPMKGRNELINGDGSAYNYNCKKGARGEWCAALIMVDGWKIKEDYPW